MGRARRRFNLGLRRDCRSREAWAVPRVALGLALAMFAGLCTTIGSLLGVVGRPSRRFLALSLGFAAGVMLLVSFLELLPKGIAVIGLTRAYAAFLGGLLVMFALDVAIPHVYEGMEDAAGRRGASGLLKVGVLVALGVTLHNVPEGMATFVATLADIRLGMAVAVAIALNNVAEGIAVAVPVYAATGSRKKAFVWSFLSGFAEPLGAGLAAAFLLPFLRETTIAGMLAGVAGVMVFLSLEELLPAAREHGEEHLSILGAIAGMTMMAASLRILAG